MELTFFVSEPCFHVFCITCIVGKRCLSPMVRERQSVEGCSMKCIGAWLVCLYFASLADERDALKSPLYYSVLKRIHTDVELMYKETRTNTLCLDVCD